MVHAAADAESARKPRADRSRGRPRSGARPAPSGNNRAHGLQHVLRRQGPASRASVGCGGGWRCRSFTKGRIRTLEPRPRRSSFPSKAKQKLHQVPLWAGLNPKAAVSLSRPVRSLKDSGRALQARRLRQEEICGALTPGLPPPPEASTKKSRTLSKFACLSSVPPSTVHAAHLDAELTRVNETTWRNSAQKGPAVRSLEKGRCRAGEALAP